MADVNGWTYVTDRLPEQSDNYLVCHLDGRMDVLPFSKKWKAFNCYDCINQRDIEPNFFIHPIAWMPLPKPAASIGPGLLRCRDCKYKVGDQCHHKYTYGSYVHDDDFCSRAENREVWE